MITELPMSSPFYAAYETQKTEINAAIDRAIADSANRLGKDLVNELFSIKSRTVLDQKAA